MDLLEFEWGRCIDGYRESDENIEAASERFATYRPGDTPVLFQLFADMPPTSQGALDFVNNYGAVSGIGSSSRNSSGLPIYWTNEF